MLHMKNMQSSDFVGICCWSILIHQVPQIWKEVSQTAGRLGLSYQFSKIQDKILAGISVRF